MWLKQPLVDRSAINDRLDIVQAFAEDTELREQIRDGMLRGEGLGWRLSVICVVEGVGEWKVLL